MPGRTESEELRALQRKAYGPGGVLTAAESHRLGELEAARRPAVVTEQTTAPDAAADPAGEREPAEPTAPPASDAPVPIETPRTASRRPVAAAVAAVAVLLAVGFGVGWALFAPRIEGIPLTAEQQQRRAELAAEVFDPGSVRAIAQRDGALAWFATQDEGKLICLILDVGPQSQTECAPADEEPRGVGAAVPIPSAASDEDELFGGNADGETVYASLLLSTTGEPMVGIQRWNASSSIMEQFEGEERDRAEALVAEGYEFGLSLVGTFRGQPVWLGDRAVDQSTTERCLLVDAAQAVSCGPFSSAIAEGLFTHVVDVAPDGSVASIAVLELRFTRQQTPYLTVTTDASLSLVAPGDSVVVPGPPGDPIEVETPNRGADG